MKNHPPHHEHADRIAADARDALGRVERGFACSDDLLLLVADPHGWEALRQREAVVWPQVRCLAVLHPELIPPFADWFRAPDRIGAYTDAAFDGAADEDAAKWDKYWAVVVRSQDAAACAGVFLELLRSRRRDLCTLSRPGRRILRREARRCLASACPELVPLLFPCDAIECAEIFDDADLPAEWRGFALAAILKSSKSRVVRRDVCAAAVDYLRVAPPDVLGQFILRAQHIYAEHPELWRATVECGLDRGEVIERLLELGPAIPAARWHPLLHELGAFTDAAILGPDRLLRVLEAAGAEPDAWPLWDAVVARLDTRFLTGDSSQVAEWSAIERARRRIARSRAALLPERLTRKLDSGIALQHWLNRRAPDAEPETLQAAFAALDSPLPAALPTIFHGALGAPTVGGDLPKVERFAQMFLALYPVGTDADAAAAAWESIAATVPPPHRESLQGYFWARMMPAVERDDRPSRNPAAIPGASAPHMPWLFEALLYSGIIGFIGLLVGTLLLFW